MVPVSFLAAKEIYPVVYGFIMRSPAQPLRQQKVGNPNIDFNREVGWQ